jgi:hypothetical protein
MVIYACDRCGDRSEEPMPVVTLCYVVTINKGRTDEHICTTRIGMKESERMLCHFCQSRVQATLCEALAGSRIAAESRGFPK